MGGADDGDDDSDGQSFSCPSPSVFLEVEIAPCPVPAHAPFVLAFVYTEQVPTTSARSVEAFSRSDSDAYPRVQAKETLPGCPS